MTARLGVVLWMALVAAPAWAELKIEKIEACYGPLGPVRPSLDIYPHDEVFFRFLVTGAKLDDEGRIDQIRSVRLTGPGGKELLSQNTPIKGPVALGGDSYAGNANFRLGGPVPLGKYLLAVTIRDNLSGESASFERELTAQEAGFRIVGFDFFHDANGRIPAPAGGVLGETLHFRVRGFGFERTPDMLDGEMRIETFDAQGKRVTPKPLVTPVRVKGEQVAKVATINLNGSITLNRVGEFKLRITLVDRIGKKTATFETPLRVLAP